MRFFLFFGRGGNSGMPIYLSFSHLSFHFGRYANAGGGKGQAVYLIPAPPPLLLWRRRQGPYGIPRTTNNFPGMRCQLAPPGVISMLGQGQQASSFLSSSCRVKRQVFYSCCIQLKWLGITGAWERLQVVIIFLHKVEYIGSTAKERELRLSTSASYHISRKNSFLSKLSHLSTPNISWCARNATP